MAKNRIDREGLASKLMETATGAEDPLSGGEAKEVSEKVALSDDDRANLNDGREAESPHVGASSRLFGATNEPAS